MFTFLKHKLFVFAVSQRNTNAIFLRFYPCYKYDFSFATTAAKQSAIQWRARFFQWKKGRCEFVLHLHSLHFPLNRKKNMQKKNVILCLQTSHNHITFLPFFFSVLTLFGYSSKEDCCHSASASFCRSSLAAFFSAFLRKIRRLLFTSSVSVIR